MRVVRASAAPSLESALRRFQRDRAIERLRPLAVLRRVVRLLVPVRPLLLEAAGRARDGLLAVPRLLVVDVRRPPRRLLELEPIPVF